MKRIYAFIIFWAIFSMFSLELSIDEEFVFDEPVQTVSQLSFDGESYIIAGLETKTVLIKPDFSMIDLPINGDENPHLIHCFDNLAICWSDYSHYYYRFIAPEILGDTVISPERPEGYHKEIVYWSREDSQMVILGLTDVHTIDSHDVPSTPYIIYTERYSNAIDFVSFTSCSILTTGGIHRYRNSKRIDSLLYIGHSQCYYQYPNEHWHGFYGDFATNASIFIPNLINYVYASYGFYIPPCPFVNKPSSIDFDTDGVLDLIPYYLGSDFGIYPDSEDIFITDGEYIDTVNLGDNFDNPIYLGSFLTDTTATLFAGEMIFYSEDFNLIDMVSNWDEYSHIITDFSDFDSDGIDELWGFEENRLVFLSLQSSPRSIEFKEGWNMISLPYDIPDSSLSDILPFALNPVFSYNTAEKLYDPVELLFSNVGYFVLSYIDTTVEFDGDSLIGLSLDLLPGWNLIAASSSYNLANNITNIPSILDPVYNYNPDSSVYIEQEYIEPGKAYWIMCTDSLDTILYD
ncbi:MAG: hypothetical protein ACLFSQ_13045 [Candidatus Zixiibacteriota bacterium]